jgi:hypothetical protein
MPKQDDEKVKQEFKGALSELHSLADEVRLQVHLGGMEAKDAWKQLEPKILEFERRVEAASAAAASELRATGGDLRAALRDVGVMLGLDKR